jgi:hypothetical protein
MRRSIVSVIVSVLFVSSVQSQDVPAGLLKLMPKDQADAVQKIAALQKLGKEVIAEKNALKKKELREQAAADEKALLDELNEKLKMDGLVGWVWSADASAKRKGGGGAGNMSLSVPGVILALINFDGMSDEVKKNVRELEANDTVAATILPNSPYKFVRQGTMLRIAKGEKELAPLDGKVVKEIEKVKGR